MNSETTLPILSIQSCDLLVATPQITLVKKTLPDGSIFHYDEEERMVTAQYASGVQVLRNSETIFVRSGDGSHWFGTSENRWFRLN